RYVAIATESPHSKAAINFFHTGTSYDCRVYQRFQGQSAPASRLGRCPRSISTAQARLSGTTKWQDTQASDSSFHWIYDGWTGGHIGARCELANWADGTLRFG